MSTQAGRRAGDGPPQATTPPAATKPGRQFNVLQGILPIDPARVPIDIVAGVTLAALAIPEVMGYTSIAGTPVVTGLYTILLPIAVFALLGSSRHLVVGADSATAAILAATLVGFATPESPSYVALASLAALITAGWLIAARMIGLAFLADFLARSVLVGFLTGVGIQVAAGQVAGMLGVHRRRQRNDRQAAHRPVAAASSEHPDADPLGGRPCGDRRFAAHLQADSWRASRRGGLDCRRLRLQL